MLMISILTKKPAGDMHLKPCILGSVEKATPLRKPEDWLEN